MFARVLPEHIVQKSLLRSVSASTVRNQYRRIAHGGKSLASFGFQYQWPPPTDGNTTPDALTFHMEPPLPAADQHPRGCAGPPSVAAPGDPVAVEAMGA